LSKILNVELSDENWLQASLSVNDGGPGIRFAATLAPSAFLASMTVIFGYTVRKHGYMP